LLCVKNIVVKFILEQASEIFLVERFNQNTYFMIAENKQLAVKKALQTALSDHHKDGHK
jgi:hypothetical protein